MTDRLNIGFLLPSDQPSYDANYTNLRQVNSYLPVTLVKSVYGSLTEDDKATLINGIENSVRELYDTGVRHFLLNASSSILVPWILGQLLLTNENIVCDKIERWSDCKFFLINNTMAYEGNTTNIFLVARNVYRFVDITSGGTSADAETCLKTIVFNSSGTYNQPTKIFEIVEVSDNASVNSINILNGALNALGIPYVTIPVQFTVDTNPINEAKYGGIYEFVDGSEALLNEYISILNTTEEYVGLSIAVNGGLNDAFTNTFLNTNLNLNNLDTPTATVNATLFDICQDITNTTTSIFGGNSTYLSSRDNRNRLIGTNYSYNFTSNADLSNPDVPVLPIAQWSNILNATVVFNPILSKVQGALPGRNFSTVTLAQIEIIEWILASLNGTLDVFNGAQDNRFRFDLETQRSRINALLAYYYTPADTFEAVQSDLAFNKDNSP